MKLYMFTVVNLAVKISGVFLIPLCSVTVFYSPTTYGSLVFPLLVAKFFVISRGIQIDEHFTRLYVVPDLLYEK